MHQATRVSEVEEKKIKNLPMPTATLTSASKLRPSRADTLTIRLNLRTKSQSKVTELFATIRRKRSFPKCVLTLSRGQDADIDFVDHSVLVNCYGADGVSVTGTATTDPFPNAFVGQSNNRRRGFRTHPEFVLRWYNVLHDAAHWVVGHCTLCATFQRKGANLFLRQKSGKVHERTFV